VDTDVDTPAAATAGKTRAIVHVAAIMTTIRLLKSSSGSTITEK
jgi:hypothetical protein